MLSVARLKADRRAYYCEELAAGLEDYYLGIGEAPGHWVGRGAQILGLAGAVVDSEGFAAILDGRDPTTGTELAEHSVRVLGYDATFCAPKSVLCRIRHSTEYADPPVMPRRDGLGIGTGLVHRSTHSPCRHNGLAVEALTPHRGEEQGNGETCLRGASRSIGTVHERLSRKAAVRRVCPQVR